MFRRKRPKKFGKLKYAYGRTPDMSDTGTKRRQMFNRQGKSVSNPGRKKKIKIFLVILILASGIAYSVYFMFFSNYFILTEVKTVQEGMEEKNKLFDEYFNGMKGKNLILIDTKKIKDEIQKDHPEFENISIKKVYPKGIRIEADKYPPAANIINVAGEAQRKHIVNIVGLSILEEAENPNLPYIKIRSEEFLDAKSPLLPKEKLEYIIGAIGYFEDKLGMKVFDAEYLKKAREVHLKTEKYFYVWLDIQKPFEEQIMKLKRIVPKLDIYNQPLAYIDLRVSEVSGDKIIYKKR